MTNFERKQQIEEAVRQMLESGEDLTAKGFPEMPVLKELTGIKNITKKEMLAAAQKWPERVDAEVSEMGFPPPDEGEGFGDAAMAGIPEGAEFPSFVWHPERKAVLVQDEEEFAEVCEMGYHWELRDAADGDIKLAKEIHARG